MIVKNTNRINYVMDYSDGAAGGGGSWEMNLNSAAMNVASASYTKASTNYDSALSGLISQLNDLSGYWEGDAASDWKTASEELQTKLKVVGETLSGNASNLKKIAAKVVEIESAMSTNVQAI